MSAIKTILLTGYTGFLGSYLNDHLIKQGYKVITAGRKEDAQIVMDFNRPMDISSKKVSEKIDLCIHVAGANETYSTIEMSNINIMGTKMLLDFCVINKINNFIYISTMHVFGNLTGDLKESSIPIPKNEYGMSNFIAEQYVQFYKRNKGINAISLRLSNLYGLPSKNSDFKRWSLIPFAFPKSAIENGYIILKTSGKQIRNFLSIKDVSCLLDQLIIMNEYPELLHVYGPDNLSVYEFAVLVSERCREILNIEVKVEVDQQQKDNVETNQFNFISSILTSIYTPMQMVEKYIDEFLLDFKGLNKNDI